MRIDKYLSDCKIASRSEVKKILKSKKIKVNGNIITKNDFQVNENDVVTYFDTIINYEKYIYLMMNKPQGYLSATTDREPTVLDLVPEYKEYNLHPVGRLDKDTEGLLILTNDGEYTHKMLTPKNHIPKTYFVQTRDVITDELIKRFEEGITFKEFTSTSAIVKKLSDFEIEVTIFEGKHHQIKRMFIACGNEVLYLKRIKFGSLELDESLKIGEVKKIKI